MKPVISVLIPVRNEEKYIAQCLESLLVADLQVPYEIIVIDGMSDDATVTIVTEFTIRHSNIILLENPRQIVPYALNIGINKAKGVYIARIDAHSVYPGDYLQILFQYLEKNKDVANVGASWEVLPGDTSEKAAAIALASSHPLGIGNAQYRLGCNEAKVVDTVPFGFYRKDIFIKYGLFDTDLVRNQDDEFNHRLIKGGEKIVLLPNIRIKYFARENFSKIGKMFYQYGYFKPLVVKKLKRIVTVRQLVPIGFYFTIVALLLVSLMVPESFWYAFFLLILYVSVLFYSSIKIVNQKKLKTKSVLLIFNSFLIIHVSYAIGYFHGIFDFLIHKKKTKAISSSR